MKEDKIEVGEYVRCRNGRIAKVIGIENEFLYFNKDIYWENDIPVFQLEDVFKDFIVKHSKNIIDLIEKGDYVNGKRVVCFRHSDCDYDIGTEYRDDWGEYLGVNKENIKSIVTSEQFKSIEYRLED